MLSLQRPVCNSRYGTIIERERISVMTELLEKAISKLTDLPPNEQDHFAQLILDELENERKWDEFFAKTRGRWGDLRAEVLAEHKAGLTEELDPDTLPD